MTMLLTVLVLMMDYVSGRDWQVGFQGAHPEVRWDRNCDFPGNDLYKVDSFEYTTEDSWGDCAVKCINDQHQCTHFTYGRGTCHIKRNSGSQHEVNETYSWCGFIIGRSQQTY